MLTHVPNNVVSKRPTVDSAAIGIVKSVANLYQKHPYPNYPLWPGLRWNDGYAASSQFSAELFSLQQSGLQAAVRLPRPMLGPRHKTILVAGCGDTLPYIIRRIEPSQMRMLALDLSKSNLQRARWRLWNNLKPASFVQGDIEEYLHNFGGITGPYEHIDAYGVLHHLPNPTRTIAHLAQSLHRFGTMRVMFYNTRARTWIWHVQKALRALHIDPMRSDDIGFARTLLLELASTSPALRAVMHRLGAGIFSNDARFCDTFLHPRESRLSIDGWARAFADSGLKIIGLLDRFGEWDDYQNPLLQPPTWDAIVNNVKNGTVQQNFEIYFAKVQPSNARDYQGYVGATPRTGGALMKFLQGPPARWFCFDETAHIPSRIRAKLWWAHLRLLYNGQSVALDKVFSSTPKATIQRLARIGAVFPENFKDAKWRQVLQEPMLQIDDDKVNLDSESNAISSTIRELLLARLQSKNTFSSKRYQTVMARCNRAIDAARSLHQDQP